MSEVLRKRQYQRYFNAVIAEELFATSRYHWTNANDAQSIHPENDWPTTV